MRKRVGGRREVHIRRGLWNSPRTTVLARTKNTPRIFHDNRTNATVKTQSTYLDPSLILKNSCTKNTRRNFKMEHFMIVMNKRRQNGRAHDNNFDENVIQNVDAWNTFLASWCLAKILLSTTCSTVGILGSPHMDQHTQRMRWQRKRQR